MPLTSGALAAADVALEVDARDVVHGIQHVHITLPVHAGPLTLAYPRWIPGEHRPNGAIAQLMNLRLLAGSRTLPWRRDARDGSLFHLEVPQGAQVLEVMFDFFSPPRTYGEGFARSPDASQHLLVLEFNQFVLYPAGVPVATIEVKATVRLPPGWLSDSALQEVPADAAEIVLPAVPLSTLVDSPLVAGEFLHSIPLTGGPGSTRISVAADAPEDLTAPDALIGSLRRLVQEATRLFGSGHYQRYVWLIALSDPLAHDGLEHQESADIRDAEGLLTDPQRAVINWRVFSHEYVHSWNGKYRRPAGLVVPDYQQPMNDELLWVYEGLTRYYGDLVLAARSGLASDEQTHAYLAYVAGLMQRARPGRAWRSLADTAIAVSDNAGAPPEWAGERRGTDYYGEMLLIWLEADSLIRQRSGGRGSLDNLCREFFGGPERGPTVKPYTRADLIHVLHAAAPIDWDAFLSTRIDSIQTQAPLAGLEAAGWELSYSDTPNEFLSALEAVSGVADFGFSLGLWARGDGSVVDVLPGSPAFDAGLAPGMQLLGIDGHRWSAKAARAAIAAAEHTEDPVQLVVRAGDQLRVLAVNYHGGLQNPRLLRDAARPDLLGQILAPRVPASQAAPTHGGRPQPSAENGD